MFCVIEGIDGAGKTTLAKALSRRPELTVVLKDSVRVSGSWSDERLAQMHALTWSYDPDEPVWEYSRRYWLHSQLAWYWLFYEQRLAQPLAKPGVVVVTDGWYFKHQARFHLSGDEQFICLADSLLAELPQPDLVVFVDTPVADARSRLGDAAKPTEAGAFDDTAAASTEEGFTDFQARTRTTLVQLLENHPATVLNVAAPRIDALAQQILALRDVE